MATAKTAGRKSMATHIGPVSNDAQVMITPPYNVRVTIQGTTDILFHRWSVEAVEEVSVSPNGRAKKGSVTKKQDYYENYVYRNERGEICIPGEYLRAAIVQAAKFYQDPRSPRKSASDLFKGGVMSLTPLASLGTKTWDYLDRRRVVVQRNAITRIRPAMLAGWQAEFELSVLLPDYITPRWLNEVIQLAGRVIGIGDFRPTYGRFAVVGFDVVDALV